ncbi:hypothetical protein BHE74_00020392 [Ensete ventricosum]|nr:hypothetical protein GW17_00000793 [Ensete ventricosum]RWW71836.1 hypothetical protein BHE74_00020392 [Ensete ventricosum]RZR98732.1 hypothetical protein BHM03_00028151 [Ensete ventricosum]
MLHGTDVGLAYAPVYAGSVMEHNLRHAITHLCPITTLRSTVYATRPSHIALNSASENKFVLRTFTMAGPAAGS